MKIPESGRVPHARPAIGPTAPGAGAPRTAPPKAQVDGLEAPRPPRLGGPLASADPLARIAPASTGRWPNEPSFAGLIDEAARTYGLQPQLLAAWLAVEIGHPDDRSSAPLKPSSKVGLWTGTHPLPADLRALDLRSKVQQHRTKIAQAIRAAGVDIVGFGDYGGRGPGLGLAGLKPSWMFTTRDYFRANHPGTEMAAAAEFAYTDWRQPQGKWLAESSLRAAEIVQPGAREALTNRENARMAEALSKDDKNVMMLAAQLRMVRDTLYGADFSGPLSVDQAAQVLGYAYTRTQKTRNTPELYRALLEHAVQDGVIPYY
jgi:hypothetical protein